MYYRTLYTVETLKEMIENIDIYISYDDNQMDDFLLICYGNKVQVACMLNYKMLSYLRYNVNKTVNGIIIFYNNDCDLVELIKRYIKGGKLMSEIAMDEVKEELEQYSDDDLYNINSWGADLSFREIITMYDDDELLKPELQRKYVWSRAEASRFIDSILLGLPVPSVFFAKEPNETMLIIDGFQRIMTVYDYVKGVFSGDGKVFKLSNSENINVRWRGKAFAELDIEEKRRIRGTTIHAIIFEQKYPRNDTGMFQIFERINTGGRTLKPQEIRNCVYQGKCNKLLFDLNKIEEWRELLGSKEEDARMADLELILRFFAMRELIYREENHLKQINLAKYLNKYMSDKTNVSDSDIQEMSDNFIIMIKKCKEIFGEVAFKNLKKNSNEYTNKINPAIFDAIAVSTLYADRKGVIDENVDYQKKHMELLQNEDFKTAASHRTTNTENIYKRINLASQIIYGVTYER